APRRAEERRPGSGRLKNFGEKPEVRGAICPPIPHCALDSRGEGPGMIRPTDNVEAVFMAALDKSTPQERRAFVEEACAGNRPLLRRVRELLNAQGKARGPLDAPPLGPEGTVDLPRNTEGPGSRIGPYKLLEPIGEGGMGTVWMAEQMEPVRRVVALKVIKA